MVKCWICGAKADSREHKFKASDLKLHLGGITKSRPVYRRPEGKPAKKITSEKSKAFTFDALICQKCNNQTTQPFDFSWAKLSKYFFDHRDHLVKRGRWEPKKAFPGSSKSELLNTHLYFAKILGCRAAELGAKLDFGRLSSNLLKVQPNKDFYLSFGNTPGLPSKERFALETPLEVMSNKSGDVKAALMLYIVGQVTVELAYLPQGDPRATSTFWNPNDKKSKYLSFRNRDVRT